MLTSPPDLLRFLLSWSGLETRMALKVNIDLPYLHSVLQLCLMFPFGGYERYNHKVLGYRTLDTIPAPFLYLADSIEIDDTSRHISIMNQYLIRQITIRSPQPPSYQADLFKY